MSFGVGAQRGGVLVLVLGGRARRGGNGHAARHPMSLVIPGRYLHGFDFISLYCNLIMKWV